MGDPAAPKNSKNQTKASAPVATSAASTTLSPPAGPLSLTVSPGTVALSAADAAAAVRRVVPVLDDAGKPLLDEDGQPLTKTVDVTEAEVFAWALRGETVTVVTTDGQKLVGSL